MNRNIKFRAWDKKGKGFINGFNMYGFSTGQGAPLKSLHRFSTEWSMDDVELMQYTGLKDKNGKEIYEGDILSLNENTDLWSTLCGVVEFRRGSFINAYNWKGSLEKDERFDYLIDVVRNGFEVIGNIYKNPELLEVQNAE